MEPKRPKVLAVADYYLPGFKGGGPIRTISNMRRALRYDVELDLFTRDRDLGDVKAYPSVSVNHWINDADGRIYYADPRNFGPRGLCTAIAGNHYDILYLNSFFSPHGSILLNAALRCRSNSLRIIIAPRGEFSPQALLLQRTKKQAFLTMARAVGLYRAVCWHVSSSAEKRDLLRIFPCAGPQTYIAADPVDSTLGQEEFPPKLEGTLKLAFISRVSPMKNLDGLLKILNGVRRTVILNIYGPLEDQTYWERCTALIDALPSNISVNWNGALKPSEVEKTFACHDAFAFPTRGENFGHVIFEALRAGTPVLISDQTPWTGDGSPAIQILPLADQVAWCDALEAAADRDNAEQTHARDAALTYAQAYARENAGTADTLEMFRAVSSYSAGQRDDA